MPVHDTFGYNRNLGQRKAMAKFQSIIRSTPKLKESSSLWLISRWLVPNRLVKLIIEDLGKDFVDVLDFYIIVEKEILPLLTEATSSITGMDLAPIYKDQNSNLRLIGYFPSSNSTGPRCGERRDYETYTVTFQDGSVGGLEYEIDGKWASVPIDVDAVVSWGWCSAILSDDRVKAAKHRVLKTNPVQKRQRTVNYFVAPDLDVVLKPIGEGSGEE